MNELPKSAVIVLKQLVIDGPMCPQDIGRRASLAPRTVSFALRKLMGQKLCRKVPNLQDMRLPLYKPNLEVAHEIMSQHGINSIIGMQLMMALRR